MKRILYRLRLALARHILPPDLTIVDASTYDASLLLVADVTDYVKHSGHFTQSYKSHKRVRRTLPVVVGGFTAAADMVGAA